MIRKYNPSNVEICLNFKREITFPSAACPKAGYIVQKLNRRRHVCRQKKLTLFFIYQILGIMTNIASSAHFKEELYSFFVCKYFKRGFIPYLYSRVLHPNRRQANNIWKINSTTSLCLMALHIASTASASIRKNACTTWLLPIAPRNVLL